MSEPQHCGDLIFPEQEGHFDIWTSRPSSNFRMSSSNGKWHLPHSAFTDIPHLLHAYVFFILKGNENDQLQFRGLYPYYF